MNDLPVVPLEISKGREGWVSTYKHLSLNILSLMLKKMSTIHLGFFQHDKSNALTLLEELKKIFCQNVSHCVLVFHVF